MPVQNSRALLPQADCLDCILQMEEKATSSGPSLGASPHTRRLVQADAAAKDPGGSDVDALAVAWPVLSFRPTPRSKRNPVQEGSQQPASSDLHMAQVTSPASQSPSLQADAALAGSSDDEDWSYPALDLTASKQEAAQRMEARAADQDALEDQAHTTIEGASQPESPEADCDAGSPSDDNSDHEDWSYPAMQSAMPAQRPQATFQLASQQTTSETAALALESVLETPSAASQDETRTKAWVPAAFPTSAACLRPQPAYGTSRPLSVHCCASTNAHDVLKCGFRLGQTQHQL